MWLHLGWLFSAGAVVVATLVVVSVRFMPPPVMQVFGVACTTRSGCVTLLPVWAQWSIWSVSSALLAGLLAVGIHSAVSGAMATVRTRRFALSAGRASTEDAWRNRPSSERLIVLNGPNTFAFTVGLFRPMIVLSKDLIHNLGARELDAVVAHEGAHVAGRDNLILLIARTMVRSLWFLPGVRTAHRRLRRALELAADSRARGEVGDGLVVASSLHRFASLMSVGSLRNPKTGNPVLAWFSDDGLIVERIGRLLDESERVVSRFRVRLALAVLVVVVLAFALGTYRVADVNLNLGSHPTVCADSAIVSDSLIS